MNTSKRTNRNLLILETEIRDLRAGAEELAKRAAKLEEQLRPSARGTGDVTEKAKAAVAQTIAIDPARPYFIGDATDTPTLIHTIERCISDRPRTLPELIELTGARRNRISGALVKLQVKRPGSVKNAGTNARALWWIPERPRAAYSSKTER